MCSIYTYLVTCENFDVLSGYTPFFISYSSPAANERLTPLARSLFTMRPAIRGVSPRLKQAIPRPSPLSRACATQQAPSRLAITGVPAILRSGVRQYATHTVELNKDEDRERIVILGSGWGGYALSKLLSPAVYCPLVISPRSYFVFTPLLTDAASGSLDFSHIVEPVRDPKRPVDYFQAAALSVDFDKKVVHCESTVVKSGVTESPRASVSGRSGFNDEGPSATARPWERGEKFDVPYDKLIVAAGAVSRTFDTPGVRENAMFFRDIGDARRVRRRVRECFELAIQPTTSPERRKHLLHFAIVGAGATGTELAASLRDFLTCDLVRLYPSLEGIPRITLYDVSPKVLPMFDEKLSNYAMEKMKTEGIDVKVSHHVENLRWGAPGEDPPHTMDPKGPLTLKTKEEGEEGVGICVWATGNEMNNFVKNSLNEVRSFPTNSAASEQAAGAFPPNAGGSTWKVKKAPRTGALAVDDRFRVQLVSDAGKVAVLQDVFAIGDNATRESGVLPATAQVTYQEAKWLAKRLNRRDFDKVPTFSFKNLGVMAYIGDSNALVETPGEGGTWLLPTKLKGRTAWLVWRSAYLTMSVSWRNKLRVGFRWLLNRIFGRDISRY